MNLHCTLNKYSHEARTRQVGVAREQETVSVTRGEEAVSGAEALFVCLMLSAVTRGAANHHITHPQHNYRLC